RGSIGNIPLSSRSPYLPSYTGAHALVAARISSILGWYRGCASHLEEDLYEQGMANRVGRFSSVCGGRLRPGFVLEALCNGPSRSGTMVRGNDVRGFPRGPFRSRRPGCTGEGREISNLENREIERRPVDVQRANGLWRSGTL